MKNKYLHVICIAACFCIASVLMLIGCMESLAEKSGTADLTPAILESEEPDTLTNVLNEAGNEKETSSESAGSNRVIHEAEGPRSEEELKGIWDQIYQTYVNSDVYQPLEETNENVIQDQDSDVLLGASEAGLIMLKEIDRLYPENDMEHFILSTFRRVEDDMGEDDPHSVKWRGFIEDVYAMYAKHYTSYYFEIDAITGKILDFETFYPYERSKKYTYISWTDKEILERAKELVETYHLADGEELDWSNVEVINETENAGALERDLEKDELLRIALSNSVSFLKEGEEYFHLGIDFATGALSEYAWEQNY